MLHKIQKSWLFLTLTPLFLTIPDFYQNVCFSWLRDPQILTIPDFSWPYEPCYFIFALVSSCISFIKNNWPPLKGNEAPHLTGLLIPCSKSLFQYIKTPNIYFNILFLGCKRLAGNLRTLCLISDASSNLNSSKGRYISNIRPKSKIFNMSNQLIKIVKYLQLECATSQIFNRRVFQKKN